MSRHGTSTNFTLRDALLHLLDSGRAITTTELRTRLADDDDRFPRLTHEAVLPPPRSPRPPRPGPAPAPPQLPAHLLDAAHCRLLGAAGPGGVMTLPPHLPTPPRSQVVLSPTSTRWAHLISANPDIDSARTVCHAS